MLEINVRVGGESGEGFDINIKLLQTYLRGNAVEL